MCKISAQYVKACMRKVGKTGGLRPGRRVGRTEGRTENRTDGHHHTILRPVWRRAYKKDIASSNMFNMKEHVFRLNCMCVQTYYVYKLHTQICILGTASWDQMEDIIWATELLVLLGHRIFLFCISEKKMHFWKHLIHPCYLITLGHTNVSNPQTILWHNKFSPKQ